MYIVLFFALKFFIDIDVNYPVFDNWWYFANLAVASDKNIFSFIFGQANEHRPLLLFTSMAIDYTWFGFNLKFMKVFHLVSYSALVAVIIWLSSQIANEFDRSIRNSAKILFCVSGFFFIVNYNAYGFSDR